MFPARVIRRHSIGGKLVRHWNANAIRRVSRFIVVTARFHGIRYAEFIAEIMFEIRDPDLGYIGLVSGST